MNIPTQPVDKLQTIPGDIEEKPIKLPDPNYVAPGFMNTKKIKDKMAVHLNFLKQLTEK